MAADRRRRRGLVLVLVLLGAPLFLEGLVRARAWAKYGGFRDVYDLYRTHPEVDLLEPIPGLAVELSRRSRIEIDSRGFRNDEVPVPKPSGTLRLGFFGGSTTFCGQANSNATTWPALATAALDDALPIRVDHLNAGVTGYSVADSELALEHRVGDLDLDVIVILHAAKDLADDTRAPAAAAGLVRTGDPERAGFWRRHSMLIELVGMNLEFLRAQEQGRGGAAGKLDLDPSTVSDGFRERLTSLVRRAQEKAELVCLVTFATWVRADQPRGEQLEHLAQAFTFTPYLTVDGILAGYVEYNRVIAEVAEATGALLIDGHEDIPGTAEYFSDSVHFTEAGYRAMGERVSAALLDAERFRALAAEAGLE